MLTHSRYRSYELRHDAGRFQSIVAPDALAAARLEPIISMRHEAVLDLTFARDNEYCAISFAIVEGVMLLERQRDAIVWPRWAADLLGERVLDSVAERLDPWLRARVLARCENSEVVRMFSDDARFEHDFAQARVAGLCGAADLLTVCRSLAEALYALRFAPGKRVGIFHSAGANAAALLAGRAACVEFDAGGVEAFAFARRWFSTLEFEDTTPGARYDLTIGSCAVRLEAPTRIVAVTGDADDSDDGKQGLRVNVARPVPLATLVSYDSEDSVLDAMLEVVTPASPARATSMATVASVGGSAGRIALLVRDDCARIPDADSDAIGVMMERLTGEGFDVTVAPTSKTVRASDCDLLHVVGHRHAAATIAQIVELRRAGVPVVVTPYLDDPAGAGRWGINATNAMLRAGAYDAVAEFYAGALAARKLVAEVPLPTSPPGIDENVRSLLQYANGFIVTSPEEAERIHEDYGVKGPTTIAPAFFDLCAPKSVDARIGTQEFVFVHGPFDPSGNVLAIVLAAQRERFPVVVTGAVANGEYYAHTMAALDERSLYLPESELGPRDLAGLYGSARVYAEASWAGSGLHRLARAAAAGAAIVASTSSLAASVWGESVELADPASVVSIAAALRRAWDAAPVRTHTLISRTKERCDQSAALRALALAYHAASAVAIP